MGGISNNEEVSKVIGGEGSQSIKFDFGRTELLFLIGVSFWCHLLNLCVGYLYKHHFHENWAYLEFTYLVREARYLEKRD